MTFSKPLETSDAGFKTKDVGFEVKWEIPFACTQNLSMCLADAEKVLQPTICRLSDNNPIQIENAL